MTNRDFMKADETFKVACELAGVQVTVRQASKFRSEKGKAFSFREQAKKQQAQAGA
jgi:hypothetical protein